MIYPVRVTEFQTHFLPMGLSETQTRFDPNGLFQLFSTDYVRGEIGLLCSGSSVLLALFSVLVLNMKEEYNEMVIWSFC